MSRLSEERIIYLSNNCQTNGGLHLDRDKFARAIEKEAAIFWQERMRERAADIANFLEQYTCAKGIRNLEIEEPK
jgi:hypothetical protein